MIIGFCAKPEMATLVKAAGFDTIELPVNYIAGMSEEDFTSCVHSMTAVGLPSPSFNLLFPKEMQLLSDTLTDAEIESYLETAFTRVARLSGSVVVFGSGKSRNRPDGMSYSEAFRRLIHITGIIGNVAEKYGITVVIEPLNRRESNMINSMAEGAALVSAVNHDHIRLLTDYYHVTLDHEPISDIERLSGVSHVHIATETDRRVPVTETEGYVQLVSALKATGYSGMISVEGKSDNLAQDGPASVKMLKSLWDRL